MTYDPDVPGMVEVFESDIAQKKNYIEWLEKRYNEASERMQGLIDKINSLEYGQYIDKRVITELLEDYLADM